MALTRRGVKEARLATLEDEELLDLDAKAISTDIEVLKGTLLVKCIFDEFM